MKLFAFFISFAMAAAAAFFGPHAASVPGNPVAGGLFLLGAVINQATMTAAYTGFKTIFQGAFDGAATLLNKLAVYVPSTTRQEEYKWLGQFPGMREWVGDRVVKDLSVEGFTIKNKDFEATVSVDRNDIEDDTIGVYRPMFEQLGQTAKQHPDLLLAQLLIDGFTGLGFDKVSFFNAAHPNGAKPAWSNLQTGAGSALSATSYAAARTGMMSLVNDEGRALKIIPNLLIVPPQLERTALELVKAEKMANGATNVYQNSADVLVVPELATHPAIWFLADVSRASKPFIFQERKAAQFVALDKQDDENVFFRKEFVYGVDCRCNAGFGLPHLIQGSLGQ